jgi:hypothetical protein
MTPGKYWQLSFASAYRFRQCAFLHLFHALNFIFAYSTLMHINYWATTWYIHFIFSFKYWSFVSSRVIFLCYFQVLVIILC